MRTPEEVGVNIMDIVGAINSVSLEELDSILENISRNTTMGPLTDPTAWLGGQKFNEARLTKKAVQAIRDFKTEVSGIGNFTDVVMNPTYRIPNFLGRPHIPQRTKDHKAKRLHT